MNHINSAKVDKGGGCGGGGGGGGGLKCYPFVMDKMLFLGTPPSALGNDLHICKISK